MTIDPVKIPQNVYVEDRIIGSITLRQIIICLATGALSYGIFSTVQAAGLVSSVLGIVAWTPLVIGAAFAFVKINGITLTRLCLLALEKTDKPMVRVWAPRRGITISIGSTSMKSEKESADEKKMEEAKRHAEEKRKRIHELSALLDKGPEETDEHGNPVLSVPASKAPRAMLPIDKTRITAEPLSSPAARLDSVQPLEEPHALVRDIAPPAST